MKKMHVKRIVLCTLLLVLCMSIVLGPKLFASALTQVNLLQDTNFANGYRAEWNYGNSYTLSST